MWKCHFTADTVQHWQGHKMILISQVLPPWTAIGGSPSLQICVCGSQLQHWWLHLHPLQSFFRWGLELHSSMTCWIWQQVLNNTNSRQKVPTCSKQSSWCLPVFVIEWSVSQIRGCCNSVWLQSCHYRIITVNTSQLAASCLHDIQVSLLQVNWNTSTAIITYSWPAPAFLIK